MITLALDTCLDACSAAVVDGDRSLSATSEPMHRGQSERIGPMVREVVGASDVAFAGIGRIAVTVGPGSFTGLRVGLSFAKGLGLALGVPVVGVGTLHALAASADSAGVVLSAVDAKRGQVWMQAFRDGEALGPPEAPDIADAPARAAALTGGAAVTLVGSAAAAIAPHLPHVTVSALAYPDPIAIARLGARLDPAAATARPLYMRAPDAKLPGGIAP